MVGYAKILVNFKAEAKLNVKFIVDCAKKEMNAGSRVPQEYRIPVPHEDIDEWSHTKCPMMEASEVLKMDAWVKQGPPAQSQRRQLARELEEGSNKRKKPQKIACKRGNKCWTITRKKYCPYSHEE